MAIEFLWVLLHNRDVLLRGDHLEDVSICPVGPEHSMSILWRYLVASKPEAVWGYRRLLYLDSNLLDAREKKFGRKLGTRPSWTLGLKARACSVPETWLWSDSTVSNHHLWHRDLDVVGPFIRRIGLEVQSLQ
jgi:hypothetical protein